MKAKEKTKCCPECGSIEVVNVNIVKEGYRECRKCGQEWWTDVDYKIPTKEERDREIQETRELAKHVMTAVVKIEQHKGARTGVINCPKCNKRLNYAVMSNGHTRGRCVTENCINWIE